MYNEKKAKECFKLQNVENQNWDCERKSSLDKIIISDVIGEFGWFQFMLVSIAFTRYIILAMMTNSGALIAPEANFECQLPESIIQYIELPSNVTIKEFSKNKCTFNLTKTNTATESKIYKCSKFLYLDETKTGKTLTNTFDLVCDRDPLRSSFQSVVTLGVISSVIYGSLSDRFGRSITYKLCFVWSLIFGFSSYLATDYLTFTVSRALCTLGDIGLVISITAVVVETLGNKYRGSMCIIIYTGWSVGVMIMPWCIEYYKDFKQLMLFTVFCHLLTLPWMFWTIGESIRWLLVEGYFNEAKAELNRINLWNKSFVWSKVLLNKDDEREQFEDKFDKLRKGYQNVAERRKLERQLEASWSRWKYYTMLPFGGLSKMGELFMTKELTVVTLATAWITFNGEFFYMFTTQINSDIGDVKANYAMGGVMEILATIVSILMIAIMRRKHSLFVTLLTISITSATLAFFVQEPLLSSIIFNALKFATSTLTSLVYVVITELYPTNLRQTGMGVTSLLGSLGAFIAPYVRSELVKFTTLPTVLYSIACAPATALIAVLLIRETRGVELTDDVEELCETQPTATTNTTTTTNTNIPTAVPTA